MTNPDRSVSSKISAGFAEFEHVLPIYRPIVVFALCGLHVTEIKFMYASMCHLLKHESSSSVEA